MKTAAVLILGAAALTALSAAQDRIVVHPNDHGKALLNPDMGRNYA